MNHASDSTFLFLLTKEESVIKSQCCGHHHQIKIVNRFPCVIETLNFLYYLKKGTWCQSHRLGVIKLWYLSLAMWGNNLNTSLSPIWPIFYPHPNVSVASHYLMNDFQTPRHGLHPALPLQPLPLSLFSHVPIPCPYLTPGGYLNYYTHPLCIFLFCTLGLVNFFFLIQSPVLVPSAPTRLPDLLSQVVPLFCFRVATCTYLYNYYLFCHIVIANFMEHYHMLVNSWGQELPFYIPQCLAHHMDKKRISELKKNNPRNPKHCFVCLKMTLRYFRILEATSNLEYLILKK